MSFDLPGLGLDDTEATTSHHLSYAQPLTTTKTTHNLSKECEYRFEVPVGVYIIIKLTTGSAEVLGSELVIGNSYVFTGVKAAVYSWVGCSLELTAPSEPDRGQSLEGYIAEETPMNEYVNLHFALEDLRRLAKANNSPGPRLLILGPQNAGKTSLAKILTSYAIRCDQSVVVVNLDPQEGVLSMPGTLTASVFSTLLNVEEGWGVSEVSGGTGIIPAKTPLVYWYGSQMSRPSSQQPERTRNELLYRSLTSRLALAVTGRLQSDPEAREAGIIVDAPSHLSTDPNILAHVISELSVSHIVTIGSERLYADLVRRFDNQPVSATTSNEKMSVIKVSKSGGCVDRDEEYMRHFRRMQVQRYFYADDRLSSGIKLQPKSQSIDFDKVTIYRSTAFPVITSTAGGTYDSYYNDDEFRPGDADPDDFNQSNSSVLSRVSLPTAQLFERLSNPLPEMNHSLLALLNCGPDASPEDLRDSSVLGFVLVQDVRVAARQLRVLNPTRGLLPERAMVWSPGMEGYIDVGR